MTKHTLLIVDDEPDVADSVHDLLRRRFNVLRARNAEEGFAFLREHDIHVIMTDQRMPKTTGVELLEKARIRHPHAIRLLFTGYADVEAIIAAINHGHIYRFLRKPWQPQELEEAVTEAAREYERLVREADAMLHLTDEVRTLRDRVAALEADVARMRSE
ncbi:MAG TPA: response regulator [Gemmataceae bacterium]|jgi:DNA-binding NtrC family response regulator|nr:response regulator [Gemmataceae bacterium]